MEDIPLSEVVGVSARTASDSERAKCVRASKVISRREKLSR